MKFAAVTLTRNTLINLSGGILPMLVTLATIPPYLRIIGDARFGVLALVWLLLSYFGLFEMGLGKATSKFIAQLHDAPGQERESLFWTVLAVNTGFGMFGGLVLWVAGRYVLGSLLKLPEPLRPEVMQALPWIAAAVPLATVVSALIGALEGREQFLSVNLLQVGGGCVFQITPLVVAYFHGPELSFLIASCVIARMLVSVPMFLACRKHVPLRGWPHGEVRWLRTLFSFGSWITVSGIVNPILVSLDRVAIGALSGASAVTYYVVPLNLTSKIMVIPTSISRTLFPRWSMQDRARAHVLAFDAVLAMALLMTPLTLALQTALLPFLRLWLGERLANVAAPLGEIFLLGMWVNALAYIPSTLLQAQGRPDITAKFHAIEVVPFVAALWLGLKLGGVWGAALVWTLRTLVDAVLLFWVSGLLRKALPVALSAAALLLCHELALHCWGQSIALRAGIGLAFLGCTLVWPRLVAPEFVTRVLARPRWFLRRRQEPSIGESLIQRIPNL